MLKVKHIEKQSKQTKGTIKTQNPKDKKINSPLSPETLIILIYNSKQNSKYLK